MRPAAFAESTLGSGSCTAVRSHGGITACVLEGGTVRLGNPVERMVWVRVAHRLRQWVGRRANV